MFFRRLWFTYLIIIMISLLIAALVTGNMISNKINEDVKKATIETIKQTSISISSIFENTKNASNFVAMNKTIQYNLTQKGSNMLEINDEVTKINDELSYQGIFSNNYSSMEVFSLIKDKYPSLYLPNHVMYVDVIKNKEWYAETFKREGKFYWFLSNEFGISQISGTRMIGDLRNLNVSIAILKVNIDLSKIGSIIEEIHLGETGRIYLLDDQMKQIFPVQSDSYDPGQLDLEGEYGSEYVNMNDKGVMVVYRTLSQTNWKLVGVVPVDELGEKSYFIKSTIYTIAFISFVLALLAALYLSYYISRPITHLAKTMKNVENGNLDIRVETKLKGEIGLLYKDFNDMIKMINDLIQKAYVSEIEKKDAELRALQAQVNPHFLYNTLNSINWMALKCNATDIGKMVRALSAILRYSLSNVGEKIHVKDELQQLRSYITIQNIRFPDKYDVLFNVEEVVLECKVIKLLLQPLVENSIIHGLETYSQRGYIEIKGYLEGAEVIFEIINNGNLVDLNEVNSLLNSKPANSDSYGIQNVNDRIKLHYGDSFSLQYSIMNNKTVARIRIPAII